MVDWKAKYLEIKLKYINAKNKFQGGSNPQRFSNYLKLNPNIREIIQQKAAKQINIEHSINYINKFLSFIYPKMSKSIRDEWKQSIIFNINKLSQLGVVESTNNGWIINVKNIPDNFIGLSQLDRRVEELELGGYVHVDAPREIKINYD
jgi:hypothetical protein